MKIENFMQPIGYTCLELEQSFNLEIYAFASPRKKSKLLPSGRR